MIQKHGTGSVGKLFAPVMLVWFLTLALLGLRSIIANPEVLAALNPKWAISFFVEYKSVSFFALGAVVLAITGVEALYADMGHFGKFPIRLAWFTVVLPSLVLNYFGQGALLLKNPEAIKNPFFLLAPRLGTDSITYSGDASHCYCLTGGDFWRIFTYSTGCSFRVFTTHANYSYFRDGIWPDIYPSDQLDPLFSGGVSDYRF